MAVLMRHAEEQFNRNTTILLQLQSYCARAASKRVDNTTKKNPVLLVAAPPPKKISVPKIFIEPS